MPYGGAHEKMGTHNHLMQSVLESIGAENLVKIHPLHECAVTHRLSAIYRFKNKGLLSL